MWAWGMLVGPRPVSRDVGYSLTCSVVLPVFNEMGNVSKCIERLKQVLDSAFVNYELIVVNDGSTDETLEVINNLKVNIPQLKIISYIENKGKGHAVRTGVLQTKGKVVILLDGDLDISPNNIKRYVTELDYYDLVIGCKRHPLSKVQWSTKRKFLSKIFNFIVKLCTGIKLRDTQCGVKAANGSALRKIFQIMAVKRYAFDVELLTIATALGLKIRELPVEMNLTHSFKVKDIAKMFQDVLGISYRLRIKKYYEKKILLDKQIRALHPEIKEGNVR